MSTLRSHQAPRPAFWRGVVLRVLGLLAALILTAGASVARAESVPDETGLARLVWSTMVTLDNANRTGNYDVLQQLGTPQFQKANSPKALAGVFAPLRNRRVDVGRAILITPTYYLEPALDFEGNLRLRGAFEYRPSAIRFDLLYRNVDGGWRIHAISVAEMDVDAPR
ncbi:hypothetical protein [Hyphomonas chukchiensis]|uniref:hypothetical protein n=1 Tax=Hyphomonas chukchiensis TaxID=1280947 RepID=UPI00138DE65E|nr:hypothetical protein [Hyphomonas chukchiensis]